MAGCDIGLTDVTYKLYPSPLALARLAAGSSITIATLLSIPDAIALTPIVGTPIVWMVKLLGIWWTTAILWFTGFLVALLLARLISGPILLSSQAIKLWRFGRVLRRDEATAITVDENNLFARLFFLKQPVYKLTLYFRRGQNPMSPEAVPSFLFSQIEYESLVIYVCRSFRGFVPISPGFALFDLQDQDKCRKIFKRAKIMGRAFAVLILLGLLSFISRKTIVTYQYNLGMKEFRAANYALAASHLQQATKTDPTYALAWDKLAWVKRKLHNEIEAERCWHQALLYKPDLIDSKIGLAELDMERGKSTSAENLLNQCIRLSPYQPPAYLDLSKLYYVQGKIGLAQSVLDVAVNNGGQDIHFYLACARLYSQYGRLDKSEQLARLVLRLSPGNFEASQLLDEAGRGKK
jgi:Tfp pilus assembly protein PilF